MPTTDNIDVRTYNSNSTAKLSLTASQEGNLLLPSTLTNAILSFNFTLSGAPITVGITGSLALTAQYMDGPIVTLATINLATTNSYLILGKYTQVNATLSSIGGADTVIIYADQDPNIVPANPGTGILSINGSTASSQVIAAGNGISVVSGGGTTTITNTGEGQVTPLEIQTQDYVFVEDTGTANNYIVAGNPTIVSLTEGLGLEVQIAHTNTSSAAQITVDANGAVPFQDASGNQPVAGALQAGGIYRITYNATAGAFTLLNPSIVTSEWVQYEADFDDSVPETLQSKLDQTVSVQDFGAIGNNIVDDLGDLQNAIDAFAAVGGGDLNFGNGLTYAISAPLNLASNVNLKGNNSTIKLNNTTDAYVLYGSGGIQNVEISGLRIDGNGSFVAAFSHAVHGIYIDDDASNENINIHDNYIQNCDRGIHITNGRFHRVAANKIVDGGFVGIRVQKISDSQIIDNNIYNMQGGIIGAIQFGDGIYSNACHEMVVSGNTITQCIRIGVVVEDLFGVAGNKNITITNNVISGLSGSVSPENNYGIWVEGGGSDGTLVVSDNIVRIPSTWTGNKYGGITIFGGGVVANNYLINECSTAVDGGGIRFASADTIIADNFVKGFSYGLYNGSAEISSVNATYLLANNHIVNSIISGIFIYRCGTTFIIKNNTLKDNGIGSTIGANLYGGSGIKIYSLTGGNNDPIYSITNNTFISSMNENDTVGQVYGVLLSRAAGGVAINCLNFSNNTFYYTGTITTLYPNNLTFASETTAIPIAIGYDSGSGTVTSRADIVKDKSKNVGSKQPRGMAAFYPALADFQSASGNQRDVGFASAIPVSGTYQVGDIISNNSVGADGNLSWVCTVAGTPGTWQSANFIGSTPNMRGGAAGSILYQTASNTSAMLAAGSGVLVGGATPAYSLTPTLTSVAFGSTALAYYEEGTHVFTDQSGAGLTITTNYCAYTRIGRFVIMHFMLTMPSTADGSAAKFSLPFTAAASGANGAMGGKFFIVTTATTAAIAQIPANTATWTVLNAAYSGLTNITLTTASLRGSITFII